MLDLTFYNRNLLKVLINNINNIIKKEADFFIIHSEIGTVLDDGIKDEINRRENKNKILNILLYTNGGTPDILKRTVDFLRDIYKEINFYVIGNAMSAGTMFCMSGDNIYMSNEACLGPIDPQVIIDGKLIPAQAQLTAWENLVKKKNLSQAEMIMAQKFNPAELVHFKQASDFSIQLVEQWLVAYKFKSWGKDEKYKKVRAKEIAKKLDDSKTWKLHSYSLNKKELVEIGLEIEDIKGEILKSFKELDNLIKDILGLYKLPYLVFFKEWIDEKNNKK